MENGGRWAVKHKNVMTLEMTGIFGVGGGLVYFGGEDAELWMPKSN